MPSIMQADRDFQLLEHLFATLLASEDFAVFFREPSRAARDQGNGPRGWESTSFMLSCLASAITIIRAHRVRSALRTISLAVPFRSSIFLFVFEGLQHRLGHRIMKSYFGELASSLSLLKLWNAISPKCLAFRRSPATSSEAILPVDKQIRSCTLP